MHTREDRDDLDDAADHREQRRLKAREAKRRHDDLLLVRQAVRHVIQCGEEREEPRLRVEKRLIEPDATLRVGTVTTQNGVKDILLLLEALVLDTRLVALFG